MLAELALRLLTPAGPVARRLGPVADASDPMRGVALRPADESGNRPLAPCGEAARDRERVHRVGVHRVAAWRDVRGAGRMRG